MTQPDWDALPSPLPQIAPELPYAPYMPGGVPVNAPEYDFVPFQTPIGNPYTKPDGSTAQPMASVSPNGDSVTIDTYDKPLTDANGDPVSSGTPPVDTAEPVPLPEIPNFCEENPDAAACAKQGEIPTPDIIPTHDVDFSTAWSPVGSGAGCPADVSLSFLGQPLSWSYAPICTMAETIRPLVIGFAWLGFGFIIVGGLRK